MSTQYWLMVRDCKNEEYLFSKGKLLTIKYVEPFDCHYLYRGAVGNHNDMHHDGGIK